MVYVHRSVAFVKDEGEATGHQIEAENFGRNFSFPNGIGHEQEKEDGKGQNSGSPSGCGIGMNWVDNKFDIFCTRPVLAVKYHGVADRIIPAWLASLIGKRTDVDEDGTASVIRSDESVSLVILPSG